MIGAIISKVQQYLDATISSRAPSSTALSTSTWTGTLASNLLSRVDAAISSRAAASTALSNATWTDALAAALLNVKPFPKVKTTANGLVTRDVSLINAATDRYFGTRLMSTTRNLVDSDYMLGYRRVSSNDSSDALVDVLNVSGAGWLFGCVQANYDALSKSGQHKIIVDGTTVYDSTYASMATKTAKLSLGYAYYSGTYYYWFISEMPVRFNTSLQIQHRANDADIYTEVVYLLD